MPLDTATRDHCVAWLGLAMLAAAVGMVVAARAARWCAGPRRRLGQGRQKPWQEK